VSTRLIIGDCREQLALLPDQSVHCIVTSPPYYGLRDYGVDGQIGLEQTPEAYVAELVGVFREARRVLRDDGTLWLNLGDSYGSVGGNTYAGFNERYSGTGGKGSKQDATLNGVTDRKMDTGLRSKNLLGIPWRVAFALQQPYYAGKIADERDRVWLAAMVDAEGSICGTEYETGDRTKTNIYLSITNTSVPIIDKCEHLFPQAVKHVYEKSGPSSRICYRWDVERMETKALFIREIYPYLVSKRKQAVVAYTFLELQHSLFSKKKGYLPEQQEQRSWLMAALSKLNAGEDVDLPEWLTEPPSLLEPGFYLRQDIIWSKPNPMPESVKDRCTKAHEYMFLLSKSARYWFDAAAISEPVAREFWSETVGAEYMTASDGRMDGGKRKGSGPMDGTRNRRSVWTVATQPFSEAHFATFPPALIEPCILAGCPVGGTVLDPFGGAGTTGLVADRLGRNAILIELNPTYAAMIDKRIRGDAGMFAEIA